MRPGSFARPTPLALMSARLVMCLAVASGCKSDSDGASTAESTAESSAGEVPIDTLLDDAAHDFCRQYIDCECSASEGALFANEADCFNTNRSEYGGIVASGEADGLTFDRECLAEYVAQIESLGCSSDRRALGVLVSCKVHHGTRDVGESCKRHDNAEGDDCLPSLTCADGSCIVTKERYSLGEACDPQHAACEPPGVCVDPDDAGRHICVPLPIKGEPCLFGRCRDGLLCDPEQVCQEAAGVGSACGPGKPECDPCFPCDSTSSTCAAREPAAVGESCHIDSQCAPGISCVEVAAFSCSDRPVICFGGANPPNPTPWEFGKCQ